MNLGICLAETRRYAEARQAFEDALRAAPGSVQAEDNLGRLALLAGHPEEARQRFQQALRWDARDLVAHLNLAMLEAREGNPAAALRLCSEALAQHPQSSVAAECVRRNQARLQAAAAAPAGAPR